ncbi:MAG: hypothetical protein N2578_04735, partial [Bdellovibrionaceae bacterium]|nr:hypothetical protein [Pseudobdellovibrionaceae bacterium]
MKRFFSLAFGFALVAFGILISVPSEAQKKGGHSLTFALGFTGSKQDDVNSVLNGFSNKTVSPLTSSYEIFAQYAYRFSSTVFSLIFRPSYMWETQTGQINGDSGKVAVSGFTVFPMLRVTPLENKFLQFFLQTGLGYGSLSGTFEQGANSLSWSGGNFGAMGGLGANFCFTPSHCLT